MMNKQKLCIECDHAQFVKPDVVRGISQDWICRNDEYAILDLVTGETTYKTCRMLRQLRQPCGIVGDGWKASPTHANPQEGGYDPIGIPTYDIPLSLWDRVVGKLQGFWPAT